MGRKKTTKMSLTDFLGPQTTASWADEMELPTAPAESSRGVSSRGMGDDDNRPSLEDLPTRGPFSAYVGNLPFDVSESEVELFFEQCEVVSVRIPMNYETQRPKGYCYVEFKDRDNLFKGLQLHGTEMRKRALRINVAEQREQHGGEDRSSSNAWRRTGPMDEDQGPKPADSANTWRRSGPVATPGRESGGYSSRPMSGDRVSREDRHHNNDDMPPPRSSQAEQATNWRTGAGARSPATPSPQTSLGGRNFERGSSGDERKPFRSTGAPPPGGERKKLVLQPRSKPLGQ